MKKIEIKGQFNSELDKELTSLEEMILKLQEDIDASINQIAKNDQILSEKDAQIMRLEEQNGSLELQKESLETQNAWLLEQIRLLKSQEFGKKSDKVDPLIVGYEQLGLFNEAEYFADEKEPEPVYQEIKAHKRKKIKGKKAADLEPFVTEIIIHDLSEKEKVCPCCNNNLHLMNQDVAYETHKIPSKLEVTKYLTNTYTCRHCQEQEESTPIIKAKGPNLIFPGCMVSPSLLAGIMHSKYMLHLPLYRQEAEFKAMGLDLISRANMSNWLIKSASEYLSLMYERLHEYLLKEDILHADETTLQVIKEDGRDAKSKSYMWLYMTGKESEKQIALYDYQTTRATKNPKAFLEDYEGYIHADGYQVYDIISKSIKLCACLAHVRRKFTDCIKAMPPKARGIPIAQAGLSYISKLYKIEHKIADLSYEEKHKRRNQEAKPILDEFLVWLNTEGRKALPKGKLKTAIVYAKNQWTKLLTYLEDGRLEIDNNRAERSIKPLVIGRKNWLFAFTSRGATASAIIYSIIETAKLNELNDYEYLKYIFEQMKEMDKKEISENLELIDHLMPWSENLPECCRLKKKVQDVVEVPII